MRHFDSSSSIMRRCMRLQKSYLKKEKDYIPMEQVILNALKDSNTMKDKSEKGMDRKAKLSIKSIWGWLVFGVFLLIYFYFIFI